MRPYLFYLLFACAFFARCDKVIARALPTLDEILQAQRERQEQYTSFEAEFSSTRHDLSNPVVGLGFDVLPANGGSGESYYEGFLRYSGEKYYSQVALSATLPARAAEPRSNLFEEIKPIPVAKFVEAFNGIQSVTHLDFEDSANEFRTNGANGINTIVSDERKTRVTRSEELPLHFFFHFNAVNDELLELTSERYKVTGREEIEGQECIVLEEQVRNSSPQRVLFFTTDDQFLPVCIRHQVPSQLDIDQLPEEVRARIEPPGTLLVEYRIEYADFGGHRLPQNWEMHSLLDDEFKEETRCHISDYRLNANFKDSDFTYRLQPGDVVLTIEQTADSSIPEVSMEKILEDGSSEVVTDDAIVDVDAQLISEDLWNTSLEKTAGIILIIILVIGIWRTNAANR